jgi:iron complex transport system substrate-binding protein
MIPLLVATALLATACGERAEPTGELAQSYPVRVQGAGDRATILTEPARRIVALDAGPAEIAAALGQGRFLVGVPAGFEGTGGSRRPARVVRPSGQVDVDAAIALEPDLILATEETDPVDLSRAARESDAAVYVQPSSSIEDVKRGVVEIGFLLGRAAAARQLTGEIDDQLAAVTRRLEGVSEVPVFVDTGFFITVPAGSLLGDVVRTAKGRSIAGAKPGLDPIRPAEIARANPRVYLLLDASGFEPAQLRRDPRAARITAVRKGRIALLPAALVNRAGPRIAEGVEAVARALHPDAF